MKLHFFNHAHNGDVHITREYCKDIMSILGIEKATYHHSNNPDLLKDLPELTFEKYIREPHDELIQKPIDDGYYIDMWIGQGYKTNTFNGCNFVSLYNVMTKLYEKMGFIDQLKPIEFYIPQVNYQNCDITNIDSFFANESLNKYVLICNNNVMSGQTPNFDMNFIIDFIAESYNSVGVIVTNAENRIIKDNVFYVTDIINNPESNCDLNEISYISTKCDLIVGRSSGPYTFSIVKENYNKNKLICLCNSYIESWFSDDGGDYINPSLIINKDFIWTNNYHPENIINLIKYKLQ